MWRHNLKIALRGIARDKSYSLVNIVGLAIALACSFFFIFWVKFELSYERSYPNGHRIYRLMDLEERADGPYYSLLLPYMVNELKDRYPQIEGVALYQATEGLQIREFEKPEGETIPAVIAMTSEDFLSMFGYEYLEGSPPSTDNRQEVVISQTLARKLWTSQL